MRTQTLVKNAIIQVDANPFKQWYQQHYGSEIGAKKRSTAAQAAAAEAAVEEKPASNHVKRKLAVSLHACPRWTLVVTQKSLLACCGLWRHRDCTTSVVVFLGEHIPDSDPAAASRPSWDCLHLTAPD